MTGANKNNYNFIFKLVCVLILTTLSLSLPAADRMNVRFKHISVEQGLSQQAVRTIAQDKKGFMWFGTQEGLNRFDGINLLTFRHDPLDPSSLSHDVVVDIKEDKQGRLWIATDGGGLNLYSPESQNFIHFQHDPLRKTGLSSNQTRVLYLDNQDTLWVGTDDAGLNRMTSDTNGGEFVHFYHQPDSSSIANQSIRAIAQDKQKRLWVGHEGGGLSRIDPTRNDIKHFRENSNDPYSLSSDNVLTIYVDSSDNIWIGTDEGGLNRYDQKSDSFIHYFHDEKNASTIGHNLVRHLFEDNQGALWVATDGGLSVYDEVSDSFNSYRHNTGDRFSLSDNRVLSTYQSRDGVLWVGTQSGLNYWNISTSKFQQFGHIPNIKTSLSNNIITNFAESPSGELWVATYNGLNKFDRHKKEFIQFFSDKNNPNSLSDNRIMSLLADSKNRLWIGTRGSGIDRLDLKTGTFDHFTHSKSDSRSISANGITDIYEDNEGTIWVTSYRGGLDRYDESLSSFTRHQSTPDHANSLSTNRVLQIHQEKSGIYWIATEGGGLNRFDPTTAQFTSFKYNKHNPDSLSSDDAWILFEDKKERLWIGTQGGGLNRWDVQDRQQGNAVFHKYSVNSGLISSTVLGILEDRDGNLWISSNRGLSKFDEALNKFKHYDVADGLQSSDFNHGAFLQLESGEMLFGGPNGFNLFHPDDIVNSDYNPAVVITDILKVNKSHKYKVAIEDLDSIEIEHQDYLIAFEFAALDFAAPNSIQYQFQLVGFDKGWIDASNIGKATYTNLPSGQYVFRARGTNRDGIWSDNQVELTVIVIPPPWFSWWAYTLYAAFISGLIIYLMLSHIRKMQASEQFNLKLKLEVDLKTTKLQEKNKELLALNNRLKNESILDPDSGANSRVFLNEFMNHTSPILTKVIDRISPALSSSEQPENCSYILILDIDNVDLPQANSSSNIIGHQTTEGIAAQIARCLKESCPELDIIVRWDEGKFLITGHTETAESTIALAEKLYSTIEGKMKNWLSAEKSTPSTIIGFSFFPFDRCSPSSFSWEQVTMIIEHAIYTNKQKGNTGWIGIIGSRFEGSEKLFNEIIKNEDYSPNNKLISIKTSWPQR